VDERVVLLHRKAKDIKRERKREREREREREGGGEREKERREKREPSFTRERAWKK